MAMMHSLGLLRVQNITRGGAGKIDFNMHVLHMTGDDYEDAPEGETAGRPSARPSHSQQCANTIVKSCTAIAPLHHVPQATTTKRRVQEKKQREKEGAKANDAATNTTPLFEPSRVHVRKFSDYLPPFDQLDEMFFSGPHSPALDSRTKPLTSVAMAEDLIAQLRMRAIVAAANEVAASIRSTPSTSEGEEATGGKHTHSGNTSDMNSFLLVFGDSAVKSGVESLYQLSRGRGESIIDHCGFRGSLFGGQVPVRRPMRGMLPKENLFYCRIEGIETQWTPVPVPFSDTPNAPQHTPEQNLWRLLQFCIATASVHKDLIHALVQSIKRHYAGTPLAIVSHKQKSSVRTLLEDFVLNLSDGSYRSAIFNILHSIDKMNGGDEGIGGSKEQLRFGPKNASLFASEGGHSDESSSHCSLCGGRCQGTSGISGLGVSWLWCRSCRQIMRPLFATDDSQKGEDAFGSEPSLAFITRDGNLSPHGGDGLIKMSRADMLSEISEFLIANEDDE